MDTKLALENNLSWYEAVMDAHGVTYEMTETWWAASSPTPPYYSDFVTRDPNDTSGQIAQLAKRIASSPRRGWTVADSFASLDVESMVKLGFEQLFEASWFAQEPIELDDDRDSTSVRFEAVTSEHELERWERRWQEWSPAPDVRVFPKTLLASPHRQFWTAYRGDELIGGAITHAHESTLGLSNVFSEGASGRGDYLRDAARRAIAAAGERTVVGYGDDAALADLMPLGFRSVGTNRVWLLTGY